MAESSVAKKKFRAEIKPGTRAGKILKAIDAWSVEARAAEVADLWDILTALRGPDSGDDGLKWITTARIRARVLPSGADKTGYAANPDGFRPAPYLGVFHFANHVVRAVAAMRRQGFLK